MQKLGLVLFTSILILSIILPFPVAHAKPVSRPNASTPSELIDAVNALRASRGLAPYNPNSILMGIAQQQAEYILALGSITHYSANGLRPYQRALQAGYAVAGDISQGGWFSENITAGVGMTAEEAVENWTGDAPHLDTMISGNFQDIGAGVAYSGNTYYYVIDCGLSTGGTPVAFTPPPSYIPPQPTMVPNTPNADGSITYIVQSKDTLGRIAVAYGVTLDDLYKLNGLTAKSLIYPNQKIIVRAAFTPTPTFPTSTPTGLPTITAWPTTTRTSTRTPDPPTPAPSPGLPVSAARGAVTAIVVAALVLAGLLAIFRRKGR